MPETMTILPTRRPDLVVSPLDDRGDYVVKDPRTGQYFNLGRFESFLLLGLDGKQSGEVIRAAFQDQFGEPLSAEELDEFIKLARSRGFLQAPGGAAAANGDNGLVHETCDAAVGVASVAGLPTARRLTRRSILYWRFRFFDPDRLFNRVEPHIQFVWTRTFLVLSLAAIAMAGALFWANRQDLVAYLPHAFRWQTAALVYVTVIVTLFCHEFAHGLTCKHYGGEVHEVGFLLLFFMPCFYCNVSDSWLFREKSKRLWVMLAGTYCDLCLWAVAVFGWRLALPQTVPHYVSWIVMSVCGMRVFLNLNPLLKLDGYYLLSDWMEVPNLRKRGWAHMNAHLRWLLWGAPRPEPESKGKFLLRYGAASWLFSLCYLALMLIGLSALLGARWGWAGIAVVTFLGVFTMQGFFAGLGGGEFRQMVFQRRKRTTVWMLALLIAAAVLCFIEVEDRASGTFSIHPPTRAELRAQVSGFLHEVYFDQGDRVSPGALIARMEIPDLPSRIAQKRAEVREVQAKLRLLEVGPRPEEVAEQRCRVDRAKAWRDQAEQDLERSRRTLQQDLARLEEQITQYRAEVTYAQYAFTRDEKLFAKGVLPREQFQEKKKLHEVSQAQLEQALAQRRARQAQGTLEAEVELGRREKELAEARATLALMEAGTRPDEISAERAHVERLKEEALYLEKLQEKVLLHSPVPGLVSSARMKERIGCYYREGDLICLIEEPSGLEAEVTLDEQEAARVQGDLAADLKARALPFETFAARVERVAPNAVPGEVQSTVTVYCRLEDGDAGLKPGMTGSARIYLGRRPLGVILTHRLMRFLRTELWW
jgi:putative peptide zinc metalloprotease protein